MTRGRAARLGPFVVLLVVATLAVALLLEVGWHAAATRSWSAALPVAARTLFFFGDIAFYLWVPSLVIAALRRRRRPRPRFAFLVLLAGAVLNVLVVAGIGFAQTGGLASFVALAVEGSIAAVLAGALVVPALYRWTTWGAEPATDPQA